MYGRGAALVEVVYICGVCKLHEVLGPHQINQVHKISVATFIDRDPVCDIV